MLHNANATIDTLLSAVPFLLIVVVILALVAAATKLFPALDEMMNRPDEEKHSVEYYEKMYGATPAPINPRRWN